MRQGCPVEPYAVWDARCALGGDSGGGVLDARGSIVEVERDAVRRMKAGSRIPLRVAGVFARVRLARCLAAMLLLLPVLAFATGTAAHAATAAKAGHAVVISVPLRRPGLYEVRVTVSSRSGRPNRVTLAIGSLGGHMSLAAVTTSRGQSARISLPVRIPSLRLTVRATGGQSKPTVRVLKWLIAPIHAGLPSATVAPRAPMPPAVVQPQRKPKPRARPTAPRRVLRPPSAAVVVKRIRKPGIYAVHIGISSRGGRKNRVKLQIGSLARRAVTTGRRHASMFLKVSIARHSLTVRATGDRAQPTLTISMRRISPLEEPTPTPSAPPPAPVVTAPVAPAPPAVVPAPSRTCSGSGISAPPRRRWT